MWITSSVRNYFIWGINILYFNRFFIIIFWEIEDEWGRGRGRERTPSVEPDTGLELTTLGSWPEPNSRVRRSTDWATQVPIYLFIYLFIYYLSFWKTHFITATSPFRWDPAPTHKFNSRIVFWIWNSHSQQQQQNTYLPSAIRMSYSSWQDWIPPSRC